MVVGVIIMIIMTVIISHNNVVHKGSHLIEYTSTIVPYYSDIVFSLIRYILKRESSSRSYHPYLLVGSRPFLFRDKPRTDDVLVKPK